MLFKAVGKQPNFFFAPLWLFDVIIDSLQWVADTFNSEKFENAAELGRIGAYATQLMASRTSESFALTISSRFPLSYNRPVYVGTWVTAGKYYAVEDMLTTDPAEKFGTITLQEHYDRIAVEGQEYDPYTTMVRGSFLVFVSQVVFLDTSFG